MAESQVRMVLLLPDLLGTYGDRGNAVVLCQRLRWRGIDAEVVDVVGTDAVPTGGDVYLLGGGEDSAQQLAVRRLRDDGGLARAVGWGAAVFAVCAGLQILGEHFTGTDGKQHAGLGLLDLRSTPLPTRAVGELVAHPNPASGLRAPLTGFENHGGRTDLGPAARPLATVERGVGNGTADRAEGVMQGRTAGTYMHGPALARNPELADMVLGWATGAALPPLELAEVDTLRSIRLTAAGARR
ncbi:MAG TPA: glutamine amidotransferase [Mycobacteriales bacterium]|nr:glutamine amidotransferase [Mycobacteriales bacterium]